MSLEYKDYYKILGVERTASQDEIRKAFRKLARQFHPDVAKNKKEAEEKFKEINEAQDVLGDPDKRKKYDALGANWKQGAEFRPPPGWEAFGGGPAGGFGGRGGRARRSSPGGGSEFEFGGTGFSDFFEQLFGRQSAGRNGGGVSSDLDGAAEPGRDIAGDIMVTLTEALHGSVRAITMRRPVVCDDCQGTGEMRGRACAKCGGAGRVTKTETQQVKIPAGVTEGQRLRVGGKGEAGVGGAHAGDLFLTVRLAGHPDFRVEGEHLFYELDLSPWEAVLGTSVSVPTLEGAVNIRIPAGTQSGHKLRVRGRGLGKEGARGDLFAVTRVRVPEHISESERKLWAQLAQESKFNPRD